VPLFLFFPICFIDRRIRTLTRPDRFVDTEKWRKEIKLDETVPLWDYPEKADVGKYYKQFYHKTDKVN
jgi:hypothetical protein